jgi:hypothetical protein
MKKEELTAIETEEGEKLGYFLSQVILIFQKRFLV